MQSKTTLFSLLLLFILICGCNPNDQTNNSIEGIWKSIGYGKILKIDATTYEYFDLTKVSCLPSKRGDISEVKNSMKLLNDTLAIKRGYSFYYYTRTNEIPSLCHNNKDIDDPLYNFEVFFRWIII